MDKKQGDVQDTVFDTTRETAKKEFERRETLSRHGGICCLYRAGDDDLLVLQKETTASREPPPHPPPQ